MKRREKNLWSVEYSTFGQRSIDPLWILAGSAAKAAEKALKFLNRSAGKAARGKILGVSYDGTIDVF
jgi:hypothetical protein